MPAKPLNRVRVAAYLFPPVGLFVLWRAREISLARKIAGTVGIIFYSVLYAIGIVALLMYFAGLELEWQGGFPPVLTFSRTLPNYEAVETHRARSAVEKTKPSVPVDKPAYWIGFRGPKRDGHYDASAISTNWPAKGLPLLWKQPCGSGYASFCIAEGLAFTVEQRRQKEVIAAYSVETGHEVWTFDYAAQFDEPLGGEGPRATPAYDEGRIYSQGAMGDLFCLDAATGKLIWQGHVLRDGKSDLLTYGMAASPLIVDDKVIASSGGQQGGATVIAYAKWTGKIVWKSLDDPGAYSAPMLVDLAGQRQLLVVTAKRAVGLAPENGNLLWESPWSVNQGNRNIAQPVILSTNRFLLPAGYGTGSAAVEVKKTESSFSAQEVWRSRHLKNKFTSSVYWKGHVYGLDEDILTCIDAETGERKWKDGRYGYGQLVLAGGHLVILAGDGQLALVKATPEEHEELARFQAIKGKTWNHPAISDEKLLVRNMVEMACFDLSPDKR